jgi:hypothetical protein
MPTVTSTSLLPWLEAAKLVFSISYVVATVGVIVGVVWEGEQFPKEKQQRGWRLLVTSLGFDTLFTILVLSTDGWISAIQRDEISALEARLAARVIPATDVASLAVLLSKFSGQKYGISSYWTLGEAKLLASQIEFDVLAKSGWIFVPPTGAESLITVVAGVVIGIPPASTQSQSLLDAANALSKGLNDAKIDAIIGPGWAIAPDQIEIFVGIKP